MEIVTLENDNLVIPNSVFKSLSVQNGQKFLVDTLEDNTIQIKPLLSDADKNLLELLENPVDMGNIKYKNREDIYNDIV